MRQCINHLALKTDSGCAHMRILHCSPEVFTSQARQFPTQTMDTLKNQKKKNQKKKQTNTKKKTNCGGDNHNNNSNSHSQGSTTATTIRTTTGNYQTTSPASVSSCSRESSARERSTKTAPDGITMRQSAPFDTVVKVPRQLNEYSFNR